MAALKLALSLNALHQNHVISPAMTMAGRSNQVPVSASRPLVGIVIERRVRKNVRQLHAEDGQEVLKVVRPAVRHGGRRHRVLQNQVPADDPREQLAQRGIGVGVGRSRHRHHGRKLRIAQRRENAGHARYHEREHQRRAGAIVRGNPHQNENARADDRAHAQARELHGAKNAPKAILAAKLLEQDLVRLGHE